MPCGAWRGRRKMNEAAATYGLSLRLASSGGRLVYITDALRPTEVPALWKMHPGRSPQVIFDRLPVRFGLFQRLDLLPT